jgi:hypothetical protein
MSYLKHTKHNCTSAPCISDWNISVASQKQETSTFPQCKPLSRSNSNSTVSSYTYLLNCMTSYPWTQQSSVTATRTSKHTTLCMFLWEEFQINSKPVSLLYLSSVNCQDESELTGYGPLLHNVSHNFNPSRSIIGHDITILQTGCDVMKKQHICSIQNTNFVPICFYAKPHRLCWKI